MTQLKADAVRKALLRKGFVESSGKHIVYQFYVDKTIDTPIITHMSHNKQEIDAFLQSHMANQLHLTKQEFLEMVSCTLGDTDLMHKYTLLHLIEKEE